MSIILGIDPGSRITGYGVIHSKGSELKYIACGMIQTRTDTNFHDRLYQIFSQIQNLVETYHPNEASIEQVFTCKNASSALKLGQARGAAIAALASYHLSIAEYSAREVKLATTGYGAAEKHQVQHMIGKILKLSEIPKLDAADALAIAICHAHSCKTRNRVEIFK